MTRVDESEQGRFFLLTQKLDFDLEMGKLFSRDSFAKNDGIFINWSGNLFEKLFCDISLSPAREWKSWAQSLMKIYR